MNYAIQWAGFIVGSWVASRKSQSQQEEEDKKGWERGSPMRKEAAPDSLGVSAWGTAFGANKRGLWPLLIPKLRIV